MLSRPPLPATETRNLISPPSAIWRRCRSCGFPGGSALVATDVATGADKNFPSPIEIVFTDKGEAQPPVAMKQFLGRVLHPEDYDKAVADYRQALYNNRPVNQKHPNQPRQ